VVIEWIELSNADRLGEGPGRHCGCLEGDNLGLIFCLAGTFTETIRIRELDPLDNDSDYKVFAHGIGIIADEDLELIRLAMP
ncbi:MAG: hypothetical protein P8Y29_06980, partial [Gemmatimonadota bacterium]